MKAIIFARVSDKKQDSNKAQVSRISDYIQHKNLEPWKTYELEESSTHGDRKKFQEVIDLIKKSKEPLALVVDTVDRLQRSFKESVVLDELRNSGKLEIHFYRENLVINKSSNSADILRWDMAVMFAKSYVLQLSDNVKRKREKMLRSGLYPSKPPIGYISEYEQTGNEIKRTGITFDPERAYHITKMFELFATGNYSIKTIRDEMHKQGLRSSSDKKLAPSMTHRILTDKFYIGIMTSNDVEYPHKYPRIATEAIFRRITKDE